MAVPPTFPQGRLPAMHGRRPDTNLFRKATWKRLTGTSHGTPGSTTTHAHGLGAAPAAVWIEPNATLENTPSISAASDATNISVRSLGTSVAFVAWVLPK